MNEIVRWIARILSLFALGFILMFVVGHLTGDEPQVMPTPFEWLLLACFPIGLLIGLAVRWKNEFWGGLIGTLSVVVFYILQFATTGGPPKGVYFLLLSIPAFLFLVHGLAFPKNRTEAN